MKLLLFVVLILSLSAGVRAASCVCLKEPHPSEAKVKADRRQTYNEATAVFTGKVVALDAYTVTFNLKGRWKGDSHDEIILSTGAAPGFDGTPLPEECSYQFHLGKEYLVYAYGVAGEMKANSCSTLPLKDAVEEEKGLDEIKPHESVKEKSDQ